MTAYCIGIDTGGTYTDAVLMNSVSRQVIAWRKERTTPHDLSIGVGRALAGLLQHSVTPAEVTKLSVSTTLATNAVVEGRGARVGLFVLGYVRHFKLPVIVNIFLKGGHTITGEEEEPLDIEGLIDTLPGLTAEVDSYAVCGAMSIKNPTHELVAQEAIRLIDPKPVFCSHLVSSHPGMLERSATACLHAKLMPLMTDFLASIQRSMLATGLTCPVNIICGNGRGEALDRIIDKAAITMASGPAATARFGAASGLASALVVDVGGTTTDVCLIKDCQPLINREGCVIGEWRTHVEAVDMYTSGAGGDSHVACHRDGRIALKNSRVQPLAMTPDLPDPAEWLNIDADSILVLPVPGLDQDLVQDDPLLRFLAQHGPTPPSTLAVQTGVGGIILEKRLERLMYLQQVVLVGFTPTDALHALGLLQIGNGTASRSGASVLASQIGLSADDLCRRVLAETEAAIETIVLTYLSRSVWQDGQSTPFLNRRDNDLFAVHFTLKLPIIGIGAAARCFLPGVAQRLGTTVSFPDDCEVGNAIGAALIGLDD
ncbi:hydantoinase/oxoprolinase family protein [uncultured Desulfobulbus sp.]|uniref:hydantoinase/oxoprolinase family protein n=1 Tax=uncultured Desulfobulbus sp. TaxID=239745 RepID=UPI0029C9157C|nr:hydantoinase/oxoprolinase family protein [uncultured Desulfobulbus sp.]